MVKAAGTVYSGDSKERAAFVVVKAKPEAGDIQIALTDDDGDFGFTALDPGKWTFVALAENSIASEPQQVDLQKDNPNLQLVVRRSMGPEDERLGRIIFMGLLAGIILLMVTYVGLHLFFPPTTEPLSASLVAIIDQATEPVVANPQPAQSAEAVADVALLKSSLGAVLAQKPPGVSAADNQALTNIADRTEVAVSANRQADAVSGLKMLRRLVANPSQTSTVFWTRPPGRYFEILLWGLAGVLVSLIISVATYLRWDRFYQEGWVLHVAQLVIMPLLTLMVVSLLSLVSLTLALGGSQIQIDLQNPLLLAVVSFLVAMRPWDAVRFLRAASGSIVAGNQTK